MQLIITEKNNAARRIAEILSDGSTTVRSDYDTSVYAWDGHRSIGLSGHVVGVDFPEEYADWRDVEPVELIDAPIETTVTRADIVHTVERLVRDADRAVIATDYDREGELIGKEAYDIVRDVDADIPIDRVRFSSITETEVTSAFAEPDEIDFDLAAAGEARQVVDLIWGAALTRFLSLSAGRLGDDFISVGRVQSPTLKLIVDREREIEAFDPESYWELTAVLGKDDQSFEAQYYYRDEEGNEAERVWSESEAEAVHTDLSAASTARIRSVTERTREDHPPAPFNTTQFIRAAGAIGFQAQRAMSIAEDLYTAGYITYPRTDNTVYPDDLDPRELLKTLATSTTLGEDATSLLDEGDITPTAGDEETTDHPPIHPTAELPDRGDLSQNEWRIYELVVRRFYATVAESAIWKHLKVVAGIDDHRLKANGKRLVRPGYHAVYPYFNTDENIVPALEEGTAVDIEDTALEAKETQPPRRFGQSRLIERMEDSGLGTKCLTADANVLVRDDDGDVRGRPIGGIFESGNRLIADGDVDIVSNERPVTTLSLDETRNRIDERRTALVSERDLQEHETVYRFSTDRGSFSVTGDHPLYVWENENISVRPASGVREGTPLVTTRRTHIDESEENPGWLGTRDDVAGATVMDPFPLRWSHELARVVGSMLGEGSMHLPEDEHGPDLRYRNTDPLLTERFASDIEAVFDRRPSVSARRGGEGNRTKVRQVHLSSVTGRVLRRSIETLRDGGFEEVPPTFAPSFVGALFDDGGQIVREKYAFISNADHDLRDGIQHVLREIGIDSTISHSQHELHVRGRRNLERFLDQIPIAADEKFYRGCDGLRDNPATMRKASILRSIRDTPKTAERLARELETAQDAIDIALQELREEGQVAQSSAGSNRAHGGDRTSRYIAREYHNTIYATLLGDPSSTLVRRCEERKYDGPVYDLTVAQDAPNFALQGGIIVHNSTRHHVLEKLYDRGYIEDDPPRPTQLAKAVVDAAEEYAELVTSENMTAELEADMAAIAEGNADLEDVTAESREMLERIFADLMESYEEVGDHIRESLRADRTVGPCPECGSDLLVRRNRSGDAFIGCGGYPDCEYTLPLPNDGKPLLLDERCDEHELRHVKILAGRNTRVHGCPQCKADAADRTEDRIIGACPDCGPDHGGELAIKRLRNGSRLVGCTRYPECEYSLPLPRRGEIEITDTFCDEHDLPELVVENGGDEPWELGCPICNYREYQEERGNGSELERLSGVGEKTAEKLLDAGIESVDDLQAVEPETLASDIEGISAARIREWQAEA